MRLIDADELYDKVQKIEELARKRVLDTEPSLSFPTNSNPSYTRYVAQLNERTECKRMIADAPTVDKWIPVSERLPEKEGRYIVWAVVSFTPDHVDEPCEYQQTTIASYFCNKNRKTWHGNNVEKVIAYMPLPSPYKEEVDEHEGS